MIYVPMALFLGAGVFGAWLTVKSLRTGIAYRPAPVADRRDQPIWYWFCVGSMALITLVFFMASGLILTTIILHPDRIT
jgi:hypothetical protein